MGTKEKREIFKRWKLYWDLSNVSGITRRYFVMNFTDGLLTTFGIIIGFFALFVFQNLETHFTRIIIVPGLAMSISMGISGTIGGFLAEKAERDKEFIDIQKAMGLDTGQNNTNSNPETMESNDEILKHMIYLGDKSPLKRSKVIVATTIKPDEEDNDNDKKQEKTLIEKAERFATLISILVNGGASFVGGIIVLIPFMTAPEIMLYQFIASIVIVLIVVILLGSYLAIISKGSILIYLIHLILAVVVTIIFSLFLGV
jgi:VIT1/CCC1 family predicted Fe2+/Mn2+ transporter